jgi:pyrroline-5-carboxylate reductase
MEYLYGFIGCGNMGGVLVEVAAKVVGGEKIAVCDHNAEKSQALKNKCGVNVLDAKTLAKNSKFVVMGVKPQVMQAAFLEIQEEISNRSEVVVISMAAGLSIDKIKSFAGENFKGGVVRIMPNTPCSLGEGVTLYSTMGTSNADEEAFKTTFASAGLVDKIDEAQMDGASALTGCGPAFVYYFAEGLIGGAKACGVPEDKATQYATQVLLGGAKMLQTGEKPESLRKKVCSPKGTTLEGIGAMDKGDFLSVVASAVESAYKRAKELQNG